MTLRSKTQIRCPACLAAMAMTRDQGIEVDFCPRCQGLWLDPGELSHLVRTPKDLSAGEVFSGLRLFDRRCPRCRRKLHLTPYREGLRVWVDVCGHCHGIFLDRRARGRILGFERNPGPWLRSQENPGLSGVLDYYRQGQRDRELGAQDWLFQWLSGLPMEINLPPLRKPIVNYGIIAANVLVFALTLPHLRQAVENFGLVPALFLGGDRMWALFTSMFLHSGLLHIAGNLYFLWILGDNVEDILGKKGYLLFYLACGVAAGLAFVTLHPGSTIPCVGASGAISGVMGAYLIGCPRAQVSLVFLFVQYKLSAAGYLLFWAGLQLLSLALKVPGVAWEAHLGGFLAGLLIMLAVRRMAGRTPELRAGGARG